MADTYVPTAGIHIEDLPTTDIAESTDGLIINSNNNTVNQISLGDLLKDTDEKIQANTEKIQENTDLIDSSGIIKAGDSIDFVDVVTPIVIYNDTVYGRFNIGCPISATNVSWTMNKGTNATIRGQGSQYSGVDFSDASFGSLEIDEFGGVYFRFTTSNIPSGMSNYQVYLAWLRGTLTFS